jgi:hypothetical protein
MRKAAPAEEREIEIPADRTEPSGPALGRFHEVIERSLCHFDRVRLRLRGYLSCTVHQELDRLEGEYSVSPLRQPT